MRRRVGGSGRSGLVQNAYRRCAGPFATARHCAATTGAPRSAMQMSRRRNCAWVPILCAERASWRRIEAQDRVARTVLCSAAMMTTLDAATTTARDGGAPLGAIARYLEDDHRRLDALLTRAISAEPFDRAAFAAFRAGLLRHMGIEEKIVFAEARRRDPALLDRTMALRVQHGALTSLLVPTPDRALAEEIRSLLAIHNLLEEQPDGVYAACEGLLEEESRARVLDRILAYPEVPLAAHFDGPGVHRTVASALASSKRQRPQLAKT